MRKIRTLRELGEVIRSRGSESLKELYDRYLKERRKEIESELARAIIAAVVRMGYEVDEELIRKMEGSE